MGRKRGIVEQAKFGIKVAERMARVGKLHLEERFTLQDAAQAVVGSIFVLLIQFSFIDAANFAREIPLENIIAMFLFTWVIGIMALYLSGFKRRRMRLLFGFLPYRLVILFAISYSMSAILLFITGVIQPGITSLEEAFKMVTFINFGALLGAIAGDMVRD